MNVIPKDAFSKDVGVATLQGVPILSAYNVRADVPETGVAPTVQAPVPARSATCVLVQRGAPMPIEWPKRHANLSNLTFALSLVMFVWVIWYCFTGSGGAQELVSRLLPIALVLQLLFMVQEEPLYKRFPAAVNHALVAIYIGICAYALVYFLFE